MPGRHPRKNGNRQQLVHGSEFDVLTVIGGWGGGKSKRTWHSGGAQSAEKGRDKKYIQRKNKKGENTTWIIGRRARRLKGRE